VERRSGRTVSLDVSGYDVEAFVGDVKGGIEFRRLRLPSEGEFGSAVPLY
jgi:hypothetical protein